MNALICLRSLPFTIFGGVFAMTTSTPALIKLVHQSFSPFSTQELPSSEGSARKLMFAGSEPAFISVRANAEISCRETRGRYFSFCSSVPNKSNGCGTPLDWGAETRADKSAAQLQTNMPALP